MAAQVNEEEKSAKKMTVFVTLPRPRHPHCLPDALKIVALEVSSEDTVRSVKETLNAMEGMEIPPRYQRLVFSHSALPDDDGTTLADHGVVDSATIQLVEKDMQVFVRCLHTGTSRTISLLGVESCDTVESFRLRLQEREDIQLRPKQQGIIGSGRQLKDGHTLAEYGIGNYTTVELLYRHVGKRLRVLELEIEVTDTVGRIKERVEEAEGVPVACQSVSYYAKDLDDDGRALADYDALEWVHIECQRHKTRGATNPMTKGDTPMGIVKTGTVKGDTDDEVTSEGEKISAVERKPFRVFLIGPELAAICPSSCDTDPAP